MYMKVFRLLFIISISVAELTAQEKQPFYFHVNNLVETLDFIGAPLSASDKTKIQQYIQTDDVEQIHHVLNAYVLFNVQINPESRVHVAGPATDPELVQGGWKTFLIRIENSAGITSRLEIESEQAKRTYDGGEKLYGMGGDHHGTTVTPQQIADRWLDLSLYTRNPMREKLSGLKSEYFIVQLYSRDSGKRAAKFSFHCGQGTQDVGFRSEASVFFHCMPAQEVKLEIKDERNQPTTASFIIKDKAGHIYPSQAKRLAPDFFFQPQIYRTDGESLSLPAGEYTITYARGPEYLTRTKMVTVTNDPNQKFSIALERWIDPSKFGWYSGDHHIHAAGCSHYTSPTEGVNPEDMMRHVLGEGVNVGCVLTWGPGYDHQKQFFEGADHKLSTRENLLRYDLEISGFPSSHAGHLVLLRLKDQYYPATKGLEDWPSYTLPVLRWAKAQGAVTGYAHSGLGLQVKTDALPNYDMPDFDGIGANEYIVAVTQDLVDFISTMDTPPTWELNIWYHTLNCGFRTRISGETDFPCMSDDQVAHGRSYVKCDGDLSFNAWTEGLKSGRTYVSEGKSHIINFTVNQTEVGTQNSEVKIPKASKVSVKAKAAAYLDPNIDSIAAPLNLRRNVWDQKPFWNLERGRIHSTRKVSVELVVNGVAIDKKEITADGTLVDVTFETTISKSSWIALRILPSSHSNPIFILVDNKPIRANKKSVEWCLKAVDVCWGQKRGRIRAEERDLAKKDYEQAKKVYQQISKESVE
jgi:hypothetical protein